MRRFSAPADGAEKRLIVEGWRFLPHSYAIVNQWQLLALLRRNIVLKVVDVPFYRPSWQAQAGLFEPTAEQALRSIEVAQPAESADVTLRVFYPFTFSPSRSRLTAVFATLEQQLIRKNQVSDLREYEQLRRGPPPANVKAVTPSRWSAEGFYRAGFDRDQVLVVPHGVDTATFHPMPDIRNDIRSGIPILDGEFVFLSVGAMSGNKGVDLLLRGFARGLPKISPCTPRPEGYGSPIQFEGLTTQIYTDLICWRSATGLAENDIFRGLFIASSHGDVVPGCRCLRVSLPCRGVQPAGVGSRGLRDPDYLHATEDRPMTSLPTNLPDE